MSLPPEVDFSTLSSIQGRDFILDYCISSPTAAEFVLALIAQDVLNEKRLDQDILDIENCIIQAIVGTALDNDENFETLQKLVPILHSFYHLKYRSQVVLRELSEYSLIRASQTTTAQPARND